MQVYRIGPEGIRKVKRKVLIRITPLVIIGFKFLYYIASSNYKNNTVNITDPIIIAMLGFFVALYLFRLMSALTRSLKSYTLIFTDQKISQIELNTTEISIDLNEIQEINKIKSGSLLVKGIDNADLILIPWYLEGYADVQQRLQQVRPIENSSRLLFWSRVLAFLSYLTLGLIFCIFSIDTKWVVASCGILFIAVMILYRFLHRDKVNVYNRTKYRPVLAIFLIIIVLGTVISKLLAA